MAGRRWLVVAALISMAAAPAPPDDLALFNHVTWGATDAGLGQMRAMGRERWLQWQLHPTAQDVLPADAQRQIDAMRINTTPMPQLVRDLDAQFHAAIAIADPDARQAARHAFDEANVDTARQAAAREILRALYSPAQLRERLTWFWFNHFNVQQSKGGIYPMLADYLDTAIRAHALGHFRDLLMATLQHPAMLRYLDNAANGVGHINENYAREIMELHTMGVGSGYTQQDVQELARILTGVGVDLRPQDPRLPPKWQPLLIHRGLFVFNPARHDFGEKHFLGHTIEGRGFAEVQEVVDILSRAPATAHHISQQLAEYFMSDTPPPALVDRMAAEFLVSDGDIAAVLNVLFHDPGFATAHKFKDPVRYIFSAVRLAYGEKVILNSKPIQGWLYRLSEGLFNRITPDGYPMNADAWNGSGQLAVRFEIARQIGFGSAGLFRPDQPGATDQPAFPVLQNALYFNAERTALSQPTRNALDQAMSPQEWNQLFLSSPDFMF